MSFTVVVLKTTFSDRHVETFAEAAHDEGSDLDDLANSSLKVRSGVVDVVKVVQVICLGALHGRQEGGKRGGLELERRNVHSEVKLLLRIFLLFCHVFVWAFFPWASLPSHLRVRMILKEVDVLEGNVALAFNVIIADVELSLLEI